MASEKLPALLYRACLRELPPILSRTSRPPALQTRRLSLHDHLRLAFQTNNSSKLSQTQPEIARTIRIQQMVRYLEAQRSYIELLERYNAGLLEGNQDRIRRAARRVGLDIAE
ncbi:hypothetical protein TWF718_007987 [Orbilia javanica]|uniref:Uncharacterized protein n=1 Tax=Orbilia javanica TaxID=47235 RepID=A0AAN8MVQ3_9PEZI